MGFFRDDNGQKSMTRLLVFIAAITACVISLGTLILIVYLCANHPDTIDKVPFLIIVEIVMGLLTYAGLKKVFQKREEQKNIVKN